MCEHETYGPPKIDRLNARHPPHFAVQNPSNAETANGKTDTTVTNVAKSSGKPENREAA